MTLQEIEVRAVPLQRLTSLFGPDRAARFEATAATAREALDGRAIVNVNSTATGGGVAELLQTLLAYGRGAGINARWVVIEGNERFFEITKRIHNHLYGTRGDGGPLGRTERRDYETTLEQNIAGLRELVRPGDIVVLHDPQTAGLADAMRQVGVHVVWRCHVGLDDQNEHSDAAWQMLRPYIEAVSGYVFSREQFAPAWIPRSRLAVIAPSIDPFSAKNEMIEAATVRSVLQHAGLLAGDGDGRGSFNRRDGSRGQFTRRVDLLDTGPPPPADALLVLQASRWDALKDMPGVLTGFADHVAPHTEAHLVLAGPQTSGVADDPEANQVLDDCLTLWRKLPKAVASRVHLACVPMDDPDEAAAIVNALQRHASVVVQKSLAEGFGLTVVEAMWKSRAVIGSAVGGIVDQIVSGETGVLLDDPRDLERYAAAVHALLDDPPGREEMGAKGMQRANELFLGDRHLAQWAEVFGRLQPL